MTLDVIGVLQEGIERTVARNGLLFIGLLFALGVLNTLVAIPLGGAPGTGPPAEGAPFVAAAVGLLASLASVILFIAALRTFVSDETERIPRKYATRNLVWALLNLVIGGIVFTIGVFLGLVALVVPGLFLLVSLFFWNVFVVVEDENFIEGFQRSWGLTKGDRLQLFGLGVLVFLIALAVELVFGIPALIDPLVGAIFTQAGSAITTVFIIATIAAAYNRLSTLETAGEPDMPTDAGTESTTRP